MSWGGEDAVQGSPTHLQEEVVGASIQGSPPPPSASGGGARTQVSHPSAMRLGEGRRLHTGYTYPSTKGRLRSTHCCLGGWGLGPVSPFMSILVPVEPRLGWGERA